MFSILSRNVLAWKTCMKLMDDLSGYDLEFHSSVRMPLQRSYAINESVFSLRKYGLLQHHNNPVYCVRGV